MTAKMLDSKQEEYSQATPVMAQYLQVKSKHKDAIVFFRMGDFYELFFEDAVTAAGELDIVLTKRGKYQDKDIPMCGVPVHNYAIYTQKLIKRGYNIAICEQLEEPTEAKKRGSKSVVHRDVVRILTPGTLTEDHLLDPYSGNYLVSMAGDEQKICLFRYDMSTGKTAYSFITSPELLTDYCLKINPSEIIYSEIIHREWLNKYVADAPSSKQFINFNAKDRYPNFDDLTLKSVNLLLSYLQKTQKNEEFLFLDPVFANISQVLDMDASTVKNLEILKSTDGERQNSLIWVLDNMVTKGGTRLLTERLVHPITDKAILEERYLATEFFIHHPTLSETLRQNFKALPDMARILGRIRSMRGTPADLGNIYECLKIIYETFEQVELHNYDNVPSELVDAYQQINQDFMAYHELEEALCEAPPVTLKIGGFIREGYDGTLDEFARLRDNASEYIIALEQKYKNLTDITTLKIKHNNLIGYYIEIPASQSDKILGRNFEATTFIHKQTMAGALRFSSDELIMLEKKITEAQSSFNKRELEIFTKLSNLIIDDAVRLAEFADGFALFDLYASHAVFVRDYDYVKPELLNERGFSVKALRHPVIEKIHKVKSKRDFIPNDCHFLSHVSGKKNVHTWLLTGPNMGGKSTFLRQNALAIIMAQSGFYVSATSYKAGIFDAVFSRVGASDNLSKGQSTFMTEMLEVASILKRASFQSFVILDEIGRGTSTYDGLALAYNTVDYIVHHNNALTLCATHYHEMTALTMDSQKIGHLQVTLCEQEGEIIFLHQINRGAAKKSYGIHVAKLAGMPLEVIKNAESFLKNYTPPQEEKKISNDDGLFVKLPAEIPSYLVEIEDCLKTIDVTKITPIEALGFVDMLKKKICS